jgi:signal transduction histidine kinase
MNSYPGKFSQIVTNLLLNTRLHGFEGQTSRSILITVSVENNKLCLVYEDSGKGNSEKDQKKVFEPYFTTKRGEGGGGLGMHIIKNIVAQSFHGTITVESSTEPNESFTCFIIEIPQDQNEIVVIEDEKQ